MLKQETGNHAAAGITDMTMVHSNWTRKYLTFYLMKFVIHIVLIGIEKHVVVASRGNAFYSAILESLHFII